VSGEAGQGDPQVVLGRIAGAYGIKGWVKVVSFTRPEDSILDYDDWIVGSPGYVAELVEGKTHGSGLIAQITDAKGQVIEDRTAAERLVGLEIAVPRSALPATEGDEVYWFDLIGMAVRSSEGQPLGVVEALTDNGAQDVLVVRDVAAKDEQGQPLQRLIPFVRGPIIESVSLAERLIVAHWQPEW
jgi:16S rRNA processing protein RimM